MKISPIAPKLETLQAFHRSLAQALFTYPEQAATKEVLPPAGYDFDDNQVYLGKGEEVFASAKAALGGWRMFPDSWTLLHPRPAPMREGQEVAVLFRLFGLWWFNACRIVYTVDEPGRFGFAYGTLDGHVECGEERFLVYQDEEGSVWYRITAFSRPNTWMTRLGYPLARRFQARFVRDSMRRMQQYAQTLAYA